MTIKNASASSDPAEHEQAKKDLNEFVNNLRKHFKEEEQIVFPLTLKARICELVWMDCFRKSFL